MTSARVVLSVPGEARIERVRNLGYREGDRSAMFDLYRPAGGDGTPPAVVFVHGDTADPARIAHAKDWGQYVSWGELCAAEGLAAIAFDHRSAHRGTRMPDVVADVEAVLDHLAANAEALRVDGTRVALVAVSMGVPFGLRVAFDRRAALRCVVALYGPMDLNGLPGRDGVAPEVLAEFSPLHHLRAGHELPPLLVARAGGDQPVLNASIDAFVAEALSRNLELDLLNHPAGPHAFDVRDRSPRSRAVIAATLRFLRTHLERA